jgi:hypothetical protein
MNLERSKICPAVVLVAMLGSAACAQEFIDLAYDVPVGHAYRFEEVSTSDLKLRIQAGGQEFEAEQTSRGTMRGTARVLEVRGGTPSVVLVAFEAGLGQESTSFGQAQPPIPFSLSGRSVRVVVDEAGGIRFEPADEAGPLPEIPEGDRNTVKDLVVPDPDFPPAEPVGVGSRWTARLDQDEPGSELEMTFEVQRFDEIDGVRVAVLDATGTLDQQAEGNRFTSEVSGTVRVDVATGLPIWSELSGPVTTSGRIEQGGRAFTISGTGTIAQSSSQRPIENPAANPANEAGEPDEAAGPAEPGDGANVPPAIDGWVVFTEPVSGARFQHPADWRVQPGPQGMVLIPAGYDPGAELIVASGMEAGGVTDAKDDRVVQQLDQTIRALAPMLRRSSEPETMDVFGTGASGAVHQYSGTMPDGRTTRCAALVRIGDGLALAFSIIATPERLDQRLPTLRAMAATLYVPSSQPATPGDGARTDDRRLIGMFGGEALAGGGDAGVYVNTRLVYALGADGVVLYGAQSAISAAGRGHTGDLRWTATGQTAQSVRRGTWSAAGGMLTVVWDGGGRSVFAYGFEPDGSLVLRDPRTRELINFFERIR